jgi:hypothetical protein
MTVSRPVGGSGIDVLGSVEPAGEPVASSTWPCGLAAGVALAVTSSTPPAGVAVGEGAIDPVGSGVGVPVGSAPADGTVAVGVGVAVGVAVGVDVAAGEDDSTAEGSLAGVAVGDGVGLSDWVDADPHWSSTQNVLLFVPCAPSACHSSR